MRPVNKIAALGISSGGSAIDREERQPTAAFGRPTLHLNNPVTVPRRTKHKYVHAKLDDKGEQRLLKAILDQVTVRDEHGRRRLPAEGGATAKARALIVEEIARIVGPHQIASITKHPPFEKFYERVIEELSWLQPVDAGAVADTRDDDLDPGF